jgi:hypothetical protein
MFFQSLFSFLFFLRKDVPSVKTRLKRKARKDGSYSALCKFYLADRFLSLFILLIQTFTFHCSHSTLSIRTLMSSSWNNLAPQILVESSILCQRMTTIAQNTDVLLLSVLFLGILFYQPK